MNILNRSKADQSNCFSFFFFSFVLTNHYISFRFQLNHVNMNMTYIRMKRKCRSDKQAKIERVNILHFERNGEEVNNIFLSVEYNRRNGFTFPIMAFHFICSFSIALLWNTFECERSCPPKTKLFSFVIS